MGNYFEDGLDPQLSSVLTTPPAYLAAWTDENVARNAPRDETFPPAPPTPPDPDVDFYNKMIPGPAGAPEVRVRIYEPKVKDEILPGVLYLHYGGYSIGSPEHEDLNCIRYVKEVKCVVVSVDYRMTPENPAPAAYEDCYAALCWFAANAKDMGVDPDRIAVTGFSAGGGLTCSLVLLARDRKGPKICFQMPLAATIDDRLATDSTKNFTDKRGLNYESCKNIWNMYVGKGHENRDDVDKYAAPARETDYSNLPPCYSFVGGLDPHRDEMINWISNLAKAGVPASFSLFAGGLHGFDLENPDAFISKLAVDTSTAYLRRALHGDK